MKTSDSLTTKKNKLKVPHVYTIVISMVILATILTWIIPAGEFQSIKNEVTGQIVVVPGTFQFVKQQGISLITVPVRLVMGLIGTAQIGALLLMSGGAFAVIIKTGMIQTFTSVLARKAANNSIFVIPAFLTIFSLIGMVTSGNAIIGFAPLIVIISRSLGYDAVVGVAMVCLAVGIGFSSGPLNSSTTAIAQSIAGLPIFSGIVYRLISWFVFLVITILYTMNYARKIKKDPKLSVVYELEEEERKKGSLDINSVENSLNNKVNVKHILVAIIFIFGFGFIMFARDKFKLGLPQISAIFLTMGVLSGLVSRYSLAEISTEFVKGAQGTIFGLLLVGFSRSISSVLADGKILDTTIYYLAQSLNYVPDFFQAGFMYLMQVVINSLIVSGSGQATATMPIVLPVGDLINMTRQTIVLSFNFGDGLSNYILPMSAALMGFLAMVNVPYDKWMKFMGKAFSSLVISRYYTFNYC